MIAFAWFPNGAGTACTKHLSRLNRRRVAAAARARRARGLETILCPHAVPFKELTHRPGDRGQLVRGLGEGQSSHHPRSFVILIRKRSGSGCPIPAMRCRASLPWILNALCGAWACLDARSWMVRPSWLELGGRLTRSPPYTVTNRFESKGLPRSRM